MRQSLPPRGGLLLRYFPHLLRTPRRRVVQLRAGHRKVLSGVALSRCASATGCGGRPNHPAEVIEPSSKAAGSAESHACGPGRPAGGGGGGPGGGSGGSGGGGSGGGSEAAGAEHKQGRGKRAREDGSASAGGSTDSQMMDGQSTPSSLCPVGWVGAGHAVGGNRPHSAQHDGDWFGAVDLHGLIGWHSG